MNKTPIGNEQAEAANTSVFSEANFEKINGIMYEHKCPEGTHLYWEGDAADKLYYLKKGRVKITKATDEGKQIIMYMFNRGDLFGQLDTFAESVHSYNAEVVEDCVLGIIQQRDLEILLWQHGDLAVEFMRWMGNLHRMTQTKFRDLMLFGKPGALCSTLIRLSNSFGLPLSDNSVEITKRFTNTELAELIGATRESVNRMLSDLKNMNVIEYEHSRIVINDLAYLRDQCQCENCPVHLCRI